MLKLLFLVLFLLFPLTLYRVKVLRIKLSYISILSILFWGIIIFEYIGLALLMFDIDKFRSSEITNKNILFQVFIGTLTTLVILIIHLDKTPISTINRSKVYHRTKSSVFLFFDLLLVTCISVLILYINKIGFKNIALFSALSILESNNLTLLRSEMTNNFVGYHWYYLFTNRLMLFCNYFYFSNYLIESNKKNLVRFSISLVATVLSLIMSTEKGPFAYFLISLFFCYTIIRKRKISLKSISKLGFPILIVLTFFYVTFMKVGKIGDAIGSVFSRTLTGQIQPAYHYFEFFPNVQPFLLGRSTTNPGGIFPFTPYNIPQEVMAWYNKQEYLSGIVGSMPTIFWGEAYANFGYLGIIIVPSIIFYLIRLIEKIFSSQQLNSIIIAAYVWVIMYFLNLSGTGYSNYIFDIYGTGFLFTLIIALLVQNNGKLYFTKS